MDDSEKFHSLFEAYSLRDYTKIGDKKITIHSAQAWFEAAHVKNLSRTQVKMMFKKKFRHTAIDENDFVEFINDVAGTTKLTTHELKSALANCQPPNDDACIPTTGMAAIAYMKGFAEPW